VKGTRGSTDRNVLRVECAQVVAVLGLASIVLEYFTSSLFVLLIGIFMGLALVLVHATFRSPNLKARLSSFREEFRAVWRGYSYEA